jgi:hypothetical protein
MVTLGGRRMVQVPGEPLLAGDPAHREWHNRMQKGGTRAIPGDPATTAGALAAVLAGMD